MRVSSWTGSRFGQQVELDLGKHLGPAGQEERVEETSGEGNLRAGCSAEVPPQGGSRTAVSLAHCLSPDIPADKDS